MTWPGWEHFSPNAAATTAKRPKYASQHVFVTDDLTLFTRAEIETLALQQDVEVDRLVQTTRGRLPSPSLEKTSERYRAAHAFHQGTRT